MDAKRKNEEFAKDWAKTSGEILGMVFDVQSFISATVKFADAAGGRGAELKIRAVLSGDSTVWQFTRGAEAVNHARGEAMKTLSSLLRESNVTDAHVITADRDLHCRISKKGRVLVSRSKPNLGRDPEAARAHNREKDYPLTRFDSSKLLLVLGIADPDGEIKPTMRAKFRQVNEFLRNADATLDELKVQPDRPLDIYDIGCGKSYLSFSAKAYIEATRGVKVRLTGIDRNDIIIASCRRMAEALGDSGEGANFIAADIAGHKPASAPDIVLSLHACDTATDEAMAFGVENGARAILCAPCCQHELQQRMATNGPNRALLRSGILRERLADILTDAFRAQVFRIMGYRTQVVEFIEPDATARNIMIRAVRTSRIGAETAVAEYLELRNEWNCTPFIASRLAHLCPEIAPAEPTA